MTNFKHKSLLIVISLLVFLSSCDNEEHIGIKFGAAFDSLLINLDATETEKTIPIVFNIPAEEDGELTISFTTENTIYNTDFSTVPEINTDNKIIVPFSKNDVFASIHFSKLQEAIQGQNKTVRFIIDINTHSDSQISGNSRTMVSYNEIASLGTTLNPSIGGPNQNNSVFIDLSAEFETAILRDTWDLGFYSGNEFRVVLNSTISMAAAELNATDIDAVTENDVTDLQPLMHISTFNGTNVPYFDAANGHINGTVISEISSNPDDNKVYVVNLGKALSYEIPSVGSVNTAGDNKGWKKIRILKDGDNYRLQYADLNDTTHQEISISKQVAYNFTFFNFTTNSTVSVEPEKDKWDLNFTVMADEFFFGSGASAGFISFSDFILTNSKNNVKAYFIDGNYDDFTLSNVDESQFSNNHNTIGSKWRSVYSGAVTPNRFFIIKDTENNIYKIQFTAFLNDSGVRGFPEFKYLLLQ
jgi:hypothetical protein